MQLDVLSILPIEKPLSVTKFAPQISIDKDANLTLLSKIDNHVKITLYDITGAKITDIYTGMLNKDSQQLIPLNPTSLNLSSGVYIFSVKTSKSTIGYKFLVEN
ncbi:T9SS type A sorting domain-containing protein [Aquimarina agarivorans]|uniref:T9SS type A sorting domain-containing protein n=1 Tax=Aquimarina agarivorans TaxID=980584 RepID=UPI000248FD52|nr:T9SS type A sorting domain-containing protein [Aquimarina agarivorans]